jgi:hypothetical protein
MANITTTELSNSIPTIVAAEALQYLQANTVLAMLVNRDYDDEVASFGETVDIPYGGDLSVNDKAENGTVTLQTPSDAKYSVTLNKHKEVSFLIEDFGKAVSRPNWIDTYSNQAMSRLAEQIDSDIAGLYSGFSQSIDATGGLAEDDFRNGRRLLNAAKAPTRGRVAVLHEDAEYELLGIERFVNRDYAELQGAPAGLIDSYQGRFMGFDVYMDQMISVVTAEAKNLLMHPNAIVLATRPMPPAPANAGALQTTMSENGMIIRVTTSYDTDYLGVKITLDVLYGVAELRDNHGVVLRTAEI